MINIFKDHGILKGVPLCLICLFAALSTHAQNQSSCWTVGGGPGSIGPIPPNFQGNNATPSGPFYIRVYPHVIRRQDGSGGASEEAVDAAIRQLWSTGTNKPKALIATTVKGKGVPFMESNNLWHYTRLDPQTFAEAISALSLPGGTQ